LTQVRNILVPQSPEPRANEQAPGQTAASIVSDAASILDEEMAKGVLAARGVSQAPRDRNPDQVATVLRQVHEVIDNIARVWPSVEDFSRRSGALVQSTNRGDDDALPTLKPASVLHPGERGAIFMLLRNKEDRAVRLTPLSTDLIGSTGGRIASQALEFVPADVQLDPGAQREVTGRIVVPFDTLPGCYTGLVVVSGVEYLRGLIAITIE
jgi:hypothetical protein